MRLRHLLKSELDIWIIASCEATRILWRSPLRSGGLAIASVEMERVIGEARRNNQPAYIAVPSDYALSPVMSADVKPIVRRSNEVALRKAMAMIEERINKAKSVVAFPAFTILRLGLQKQAQKTIEALGCPFATTLMEKCVIDEGHRQFAGMYAGAVSDPKTRQIVEGTDLVLDLGGVNLNDITTAAYSAQLDLSRFITVGLDDVRIGEHRTKPVIQDVPEAARERVAAAC